MCKYYMIPCMLKMSIYFDAWLHWDRIHVICPHYVFVDTKVSYIILTKNSDMLNKNSLAVKKCKVNQKQRCMHVAIVISDHNL